MTRVIKTTRTQPNNRGTRGAGGESAARADHEKGPSEGARYKQDGRRKA